MNSAILGVLVLILMGLAVSTDMNFSLRRSRHALPPAATRCEQP